ncbi:hypothetical protein Q1695_006937 [Nippostrongylus brasiliensis]|nr:hypothetical protein Q1695_006937 [Nippostrongylus brasiliensis]
MRLLWCVFIEEKETRICCIRIPNRPLAAVCALLQLSVAFTSLFQHVFSIYKHRHVFLCRSGIADGAPLGERLLAYDVIIFDFGLMHRVLGTEECVANYLDGGYMRFGWCIEQSSALCIALFSLICMPRPLWLLWPGLLLQSSYSLGLSVLTMATAPKLLEALGGRVDLNLAVMFSIYIFGFLFNWIFTFILWHHYWHLEQLYSPTELKRSRSYKAPGVRNV